MTVTGDTGRPYSRAEMAAAMQANVTGCLGAMLQQLRDWPAELRAELLRELSRQAIDRARELEEEGGSARRPSGIRGALLELAPARRTLEQLRTGELPSSAERLEAVRCQVVRCIDRLEAFEAYNPPPRRRAEGGRA